MSAEQIDLYQALNTATSEILNGQSDWSTNISIVDYLNAHVDEAPKFIGELKKRMTHKNHSIALSSLALIEAVVKNCPRLHSLIATKDFMEALVKTLPKRIRDPSAKSLFRLDSAEDLTGMDRYDRVLILIESFGKAFSHSSSCPLFFETYRDLQRKGVKFPDPDKNEGAPVFTPPVRKDSATKSTPKAKSTSSTTGSSKSAPSPAPAPASSSSSSEGPVIVKFNDQQAQAAWDSSLLLLEMSGAASTFTELQSSEIVTELFVNVQASQKTVAARLGSESVLTNERLMGELLAANDAINCALQYLKNLASGKIKGGTKPTMPLPPEWAVKKPPTTTPATPAPAPSSTPNKSQSANTANTVDLFGLGSSSSSSAASSSSSSSSPSLTTPSSSSPPIIPKLAPPSDFSATPKRKSKGSPNINPVTPPTEAPKNPPTAVADPFDLLFFGGATASVSSQLKHNTPPAAAPSNDSTANVDLLSMFGVTVPAPAPVAAQPSSSKNEIDSSFPSGGESDDPFLALAKREDKPASESSKDEKKKSKQDTTTTSDDLDDPFAKLALR